MSLPPASPIKNRAHRRTLVALLTAVALVLVAAALSLFCGSVHLPAAQVWAALTGNVADETVRFIVMESRLPSAITALFCGAGLAAAGLLLQTSFQNPLADPSILGINAGASLGVAIVMLAMGGTFSLGSVPLGGMAAILLAAFAGSALVLGLLVFFASVLRNNLMLLIVGIMVSYVTSALISLLNALSTADGVHSFIFWGMGNFGGVGRAQLPFFCGVMAAGLLASLLLAKPLNALLLGEDYARNLGVNVRRVHVQLLVVTGVLSAVATAFCGPIAFLGLAVPHMARLLLGTANHRSLLPVTMLMGAAVAMLSGWLCNLPGDRAGLPLNVVTPLWGVPVILYVLLLRRSSL